MKRISFIAPVCLTLLFLSSFPGFCDDKASRLDDWTAFDTIQQEQRVNWSQSHSLSVDAFSSDPLRIRSLSKTRMSSEKKQALLLKSIWNEEVTDVDCQAELRRMIHDTQDPETLDRYFDLLGRNPDRIVDVLVRPRLIEQRIKARYYEDTDIHSAIYRSINSLQSLLAEAATPSAELEILGLADSPGADYRSLTLQAEVNSEGQVVYADSHRSRRPYSSKRIQRAIDGLVENDPFVLRESQKRVVLVRYRSQGFIQLAGTAYPEQIILESVIFPKTPFEEWFASQSVPEDIEGSLNFDSPPEAISNNLPLVPRGVMPNAGCAWSLTSTTNGDGAPEARDAHTAVWTGNEMIVWGGTDTYFTLYFDSGGMYNPATDSWTDTSMTGQPDARIGHSAVWTGTEMIVWGGDDYNGFQLNSGGLLVPGTNTWTASSTGTNVPAIRSYHSAVFTGTEMIIWGGLWWDAAACGGTGCLVDLNDGARYSPSGNSWVALSTSGGDGAPEVRDSHTAVWTGTEMIVWGGQDDFATVLDTGGRYNPTGDSWTDVDTSGAPEGRLYHTAVWTGDWMVIWGGESSTVEVNSGGIYDPLGDFWYTTSQSSLDLPISRNIHSSVWTGTSMIVWGGGDSAGFLRDGSHFYPWMNEWIAVDMTGGPGYRDAHSAVWTGTSMVVWGGLGCSDPPTCDPDNDWVLDTGGVYTPGAPSAPVQTLPVEGTAYTSGTTSTTLQWNAVAGATDYYWEVFTDTCAGNNILDFGKTGGTTSAAVSGLVDGTTYYWRIRSLDACGYSAFTSCFVFAVCSTSTPAVPALTGPLNLATFVPGTTSVTLSWNSVAGAPTYDYEVSTASCGGAIFDSATVSATSVTVNGLNDGQTYFWHVRTSGCLTSAFSACFEFTVCSPTTGPTLTSPLNADFFVAGTTSVNLTWNAVAGATTYDYQVSSASCGGAVIASGNTSATTYNLAGLVDGMTYFWRVRFLDFCGTSTFSACYTFTVCNSTPIPVLLTPSNGTISSGGATPVTMIWEASTWTTDYDWEIFDDFCNGNQIDSDNAVTNTATSSILADGVTYFWHVKANNPCNNTAFSSCFEFSVCPNEGLASDPTGNIVNSGNPTFDGCIDGQDLMALGHAFGANCVSANWNNDADFNDDGVVDGQDMAVIASNFGVNCPPLPLIP